MRKITITTALILAAVAILALVPETTLPPYSGAAHAILPVAIAGLAGLLFLLLLFADRLKAEAGRSVGEVASPAATVPTVNQSDAEVVNFLAILQEKGRLVDFLMDDVTSYSDAQVGAAARVLHGGCKAVLLEHFGISPVREESEGSKVTVPVGYAPDEYRLVGKISGEASFSVTLVHQDGKQNGSSYRVC